MRRPIHERLEYASTAEFLKTYCFDVTPNFDEQGLRLGQTVGVDKLPVVEPQAGPEVVHEHRETGHDSKYTPWTTELITVMRHEATRRTRKGFSNIRVMFIKLFVPPFTLAGDFDDTFVFS